MRHERTRVPMDPPALPSRRRRIMAGLGMAGSLTLAAAMAFPAAAGASSHGRAGSFLSHFSKVTNIASTVPGNGDINPYGITVVPQSTGELVGGDTLVSNFNNSGNLQGTGTTIVQVSPSGSVSTFALINGPLPGACPGGVGLTTALAVLPGGWVVVGSLPTTDGMSGTAQSGCLIVLNNQGTPVETWSGGNINGPWDMTEVNTRGGAELFIGNVLNGTVAASPNTVPGGTVVRLDVEVSPGNLPSLVGSTVIANGFAERTDSAALVVGPTGLALGHQGQLYVADTVNNRIAVIPSALSRLSPQTNGGITLSSDGSLSAPLGMTLAPNGDVLSANGGDGNIVETTPHGDQIGSVQIDPAGMGGDLFGVTIAPHGRGVLFVDDGDNTLKLFGPSSHH